MRSLPSFLQSEYFPYTSIEIVRATDRPVVDVAIVPVPDQPAGPVVEVTLERPAPVRQPDLAKPAQAAAWYGANCPSWRKGGVK